MKPLLLSSLLLAFATRCFGSVTVTIDTKSLPNGTVGTAYSAAIQASGGCTPYKWSIASGSLPAGITATPSSSTTSLSLSGTPTDGSTSSFTVKVSGCLLGASQTTYSIVVQSAANHVVDLSWTGSTSNDVSGYNVYRAPDGANWEKINTDLVASTVYSDSTVANGSTYYYEITAVDTSGNESSKTAAVEVVIP
jgi:hypothetical protein